MSRNEAVLTLAAIMFLATSTVAAKWMVACEGENIRLDKCPESHVIEVTSAKFGRTRDIICQAHRNHTQNCGMKDVSDAVREKCDGVNSCSYPAKSSYLGEVEGCSYVSKYLEVVYNCVRKYFEESRLKPSTNLDPRPQEHTIVPAARNNDVKFSVKSEESRNEANAAFMNQQRFCKLLMAVVLAVYSLY